MHRDGEVVRLDVLVSSGFDAFLVEPDDAGSGQPGRRMTTVSRIIPVKKEPCKVSLLLLA